MKTLMIFFMLFVALPATMKAQQTDDNTLAINNYFQQINNKQVTESTDRSVAKEQTFVNLVQTGNENTVYINALQAGDNQVVNQTGAKNNYEYYNYYSAEHSNLKVNQEGTLNSLQIFGENSLMKNAIINQKSDFKSIVVKNFTN